MCTTKYELLNNCVCQKRKTYRLLLKSKDSRDDISCFEMKITSFNVLLIKKINIFNEADGRDSA